MDALFMRVSATSSACKDLQIYHPRPIFTIAHLALAKSSRKSGYIGRNPRDSNAALSE